MDREREDLETHPSLLIRVRDSADSVAWQRFVNVYGRLILAECRRRGLSWNDAEDVTQHVLARLFQAIRTFEYSRERGRFRDWLGTIVRNEVRRFQNRHANANHDTSLDPEKLCDSDPAWNESFAQHVLATALEECRPHFEPQTWAAFQRVWIDQLPAAQVARELAMPLDGVYVAKSRVLKRVAAVVEELTEDLAFPS